MGELEKSIRAEIETAGPMRFDRFMELALYHPDHGYYARPDLRVTTGKRGDFFTSVSVGPLFGRLLGAQCRQMWEQFGRPVSFWIIEQGAHDGRLAEDILLWAREGGDDFYAALNYGIVEPSKTSRATQRPRFQAAGLSSKIGFFRSLADLHERAWTGVLISNELVDAFPVRVVKCIDGKWQERFIENSASGLKECCGAIRDLELDRATDSLPRIEGYTTEINLHAREWMGEAARAMHRGYILTIDYGFPASLYYAPFRMAGTLTGYQEHRRVEDILANPGEQDITAHVDFTALIRAGELSGLKTLGLLDQQHFLMGIAESEMAGDVGKRLGIAKDLRAWNTLTHPSHLGLRFLVLVQGREAPADLDGLRFAKPGGWD